MDYVFISIFGLLIGSFLNVCIYRIPRGESISFPPSHCTSCNSRLKWYDLVPVFSFLLLKGRCRSCGERISPRYPIIELTNCLLYISIYAVYGFSPEFIKFALLGSLLIVIGMIDLDTTDVYLKTTLTGIMTGAAWIVFSYFTTGEFLTYILGGALAGGVIALIILLTHGMGWGDFEICLMLGIFLGFRLSALMLFLSFFIGGLAGLILIISGRKSRKDYIPFGPSIAAAGIITMLIGNDIINWYLSLINI